MKQKRFHTLFVAMGVLVPLCLLIALARLFDSDRTDYSTQLTHFVGEFQTADVPYTFIGGDSYTGVVYRLNMDENTAIQAINEFPPHNDTV